MSVNILPAAIAHADVMAALHGAAFPQAPWDADSFKTLLAQPGVFGFIDPRGGIVLLRVAATEAELLTIGVAAKRRGIGTGLMRAALAQARATGAEEIFLEVAAGNTAATGLYENLGFVPAGLRKSYYENGEDALLLRLAL